MKNFKNIFSIAVLCMGIALFSACRKDLSSLDSNPIAGITFTNNEIEILSVTQFEHLIIDPKLNFNGANEDQFNFQWKINLLPNDTTSNVISVTKNLDAEIRLRPNSTNQYHTLVFTATDKSNGLKYIKNWRVTVLNAIGEGLVIATTTDDGAHTDLSHIMSPLVTPNYTGESIKRNIYSAINQTTITGIVNQMRYTKTYSGSASINTLFAITNNSLTKINTLDYSLGGINDALFFSPKTSYNFQAITGRDQGDLFLENGQLTVVYHGISTKIGIPYDIKATIPAVFAINRESNPEIAFNFYEETKGLFMYIPSVSSLSFHNHQGLNHPNLPTAVFNSGNLPNKSNIAAGSGVDGDFVHILKDKTTSKFNLYVFDKGAYDQTAPVPKTTFDISAAPSIADAKQFVVLDNQRVIYYATTNKIYAIMYGAATPTFEERYTANAGESITTLQIYQQSDYPWGTDYLASNNNQLIMSTYAGTATSGKVYILPMTNIGLGLINLNGVKTYTGFNKITAITNQK